MDIVVSLIEGGCYSAVFAILLLYSLRNSGRRERCYRDVIVELADSLRQLEIMNGKIDKILEKCEKITEKRRSQKADRRNVCECTMQQPLQAEA